MVVLTRSGCAGSISMPMALRVTSGLFVLHAPYVCILHHAPGQTERLVVVVAFVAAKSHPYGPRL